MTDIALVVIPSKREESSPGFSLLERKLITHIVVEDLELLGLQWNLLRIVSGRDPANLV